MANNVNKPVNKAELQQDLKFNHFKSSVQSLKGIYQPVQQTSLLPSTVQPFCALMPCDSPQSCLELSQSKAHFDACLQDIESDSSMVIRSDLESMLTEKMKALKEEVTKTLMVAHGK